VQSIETICIEQCNGNLDRIYSNVYTKAISANSEFLEIFCSSSLTFNFIRPSPRTTKLKKWYVHKLIVKCFYLEPIVVISY
jgi:hypothetical protein